ncbi:phosphatidylinositol glycan, class P [Kwoniella mangroviensis CBS 8886]|nr:phosphatidylinositol glycan, class P [Kwoniella mangroviensis CBS 8886]
MTSRSSTRTPSPTFSPTINPVSPLSPISPWPPIPPSDDSASQKPQDDLPNSVDVYSSIAILGTYLLFALYLFWAFSPGDSSWTSWLPDRQWSIVVPCWLMMVVLLTYWSYAALTIYRTPDWNSINCITDPYAGIPPMAFSYPATDETSSEDGQRKPYYWDAVGDKASSQAVDLSIDLVNRVLYPPRNRSAA